MGTGILGKLLLRTFLGPFLAVFFIVLFTLVMQFLWKYADDLIGKGLEWYVIGELLFYASASLVPLALPLAVLLAGIMTFGNLGEHNELTAVKAAGVSLQRFMMPLLFGVALIAAAAFYFSNRVLPVANLTFQTLLYDIRESKPALAIKAGVFYQGFKNYSVKIGQKEADNRTLHDIMIYDHSAGLGNIVLLRAKNGTMAQTDDGRYLVLTLKNGTRYEEMKDENPLRKPHLRYKFAQQEVAFDLSAFKLKRTDEETYKDHYAMLNLNQLHYSMDSLERRMDRRKADIQSQMDNLYAFRNRKIWDSIKVNPASPAQLDSLLRTPNKIGIASAAMNGARNIKGLIAMQRNELDYEDGILRRHQIEAQRKFTLSMACIVLFFIAAPLGAIIRKGGLGMPMVVAIGLFLVYHILSITAEKLGREAVWDANWAMWFSTAVLTPVGIYLTIQATRDAQVLSAQGWGVAFEGIKKIISNLFSRRKAAKA